MVKLRDVIKTTDLEFPDPGQQQLYILVPNEKHNSLIQLHPNLRTKLHSNTNHYFQGVKNIGFSYCENSQDLINYWKCYRIRLNTQKMGKQR